jgi:hypothetical protein
MKIKVACIITLSVCIMGYCGTSGAAPVVENVNMSQKQTIIAQNELIIINSVSSVNLGGTGVITIQGARNTLYKIETSYKLANKTVSVIQWRTTDGTGVTTFNWIVSENTNTGTYDATISGGGQILKTKHTVLP